MEIKQILWELGAPDGEFPRRALEAAIQVRDEITPHLLEILQNTVENWKDVAESDGTFSHIFAMFLLAQFREVRAYPLIADLFSHPGETSFDLAGDVVTEDLGRILASVSGGDDSLMRRLIEDEDVNEYVRAAALEAMTVLVVIGKKTREDVLSYFGTLFAGGLERKPSLAWSVLVARSVDLHPGDLGGPCLEVLENGLADAGYIGKDAVERAMATGEEAVFPRLKSNPYRNLVEDVIRETEGWACFHLDEEEEQDLSVAATPPANAPCPCGSGRKFKRCCGK